ncbi:alkaline shock response membrane anchor protein AmaP [Saccharopolyspora sp. ASAGF58]|uniref:alkaline shock response membrane anchor protein AmaP n=1 Tax=Saccharopolyspora sp. ASAGF58 TaxID=2719023 RepID=UPI00143FC6CC|nr:alkaline shock response membrane anchor protein AmaP [Saccharopolyspora sp. ASAGF58]QIZ38639.1 alkaline shock response membrane anchor protein AmaP [Saccharopolyspora sp. ASAGF58]
MASPNRPARLNRILLVLVGVVLLAGGVCILASALGAMPLLAPEAPVVSTVPPLAGWVPWVVAVVAVIVGLLCLRWLLAQTLRRAKTGTWQLSQNPRKGQTRLDTDTAAAPLVEEIETYPGIHRARARLAGTRAHPVLHLAVVTEDRADIRQVRHRIDAEAIPRMRQALELEHLASDLLLRLGAAHSARTH